VRKQLENKISKIREREHKIRSSAMQAYIYIYIGVGIEKRENRGLGSETD
jgi:hypothetical protein